MLPKTGPKVVRKSGLLGTLWLYLSGRFAGVTPRRSAPSTRSPEKQSDGPGATEFYSAIGVQYGGKLIMRSIILHMLGVPLPIIILLALFTHYCWHGRSTDRNSQLGGRWIFGTVLACVPRLLCLAEGCGESVIEEPVRLNSCVRLAAGAGSLRTSFFIASSSFTHGRPVSPQPDALFGGFAVHPVPPDSSPSGIGQILEILL